MKLNSINCIWMFCKAMANILKMTIDDRRSFYFVFLNKSFQPCAIKMVFVRRMNQITCKISTRLCVVLMHCIIALENGLALHSSCSFGKWAFKKPMNLLFEFAFHILAHCHLVYIQRGWLLILLVNMHQIGLCIFLRLILEREVSTSSVLCSWLFYFFMQTEGEILLLP